MNTVISPLHRTGIGTINADGKRELPSRMRVVAGYSKAAPRVLVTVSEATSDRGATIALTPRDAYALASALFTCADNATEFHEVKP